MSLLFKNLVAILNTKHHRRLCVGGLTLILCALNPEQIRSAELPSVTGLQFQTSGPNRCANIGDWYTTDGTTNNTTGVCNTNVTSTDKIHRFNIGITQEMIDAGGTVNITILDAESAVGGGDEVNGASDPTRFRLFDSAGTQLDSRTIASGSPNGTSINFSVSSAGTYQVTSETGARFINGDTTVELNDDDNTFRIQVPDTGASPELQGQISQSQGTMQQGTGANLSFNTYFLVGPGTNALKLRNFDLDNNASLVYRNPSGNVPSTATVSGNARWNGGGNLNTGSDDFPIDTASPNFADAGVWIIEVNNLSNNNQFILEANTGDNKRLGLFDTIPTRAGNFDITPDTTRSTTINTPVDHPFSISNNFATTDIINLSLTGTDPNYTAELINASTGQPLTDSDNDGILDTGILDPNTTINLILRITPGTGSADTDITQVDAVSFMDLRVNPNNNTTRSVIKTTVLLDYGDAPVSFDDTADNNNLIDGNDEPARHQISSNLFLGNISPDAEVAPPNSTNADGDDNNGNNDEDAFTSLPNVPSTGSYSLDVPLNNNTGTDATLHGWIDFNQNGKFEADEYQSAVVNNNVSPINLTWAVPTGTTPGDTYARFRLTTDNTLIDDNNTNNIDERSVGNANDGEVEDYQIAIAEPTLPPSVAPENACQVSLINGNFEEPTIGVTPPTPFQVFQTDQIVAYNESDVPGWLSSADNFIEIWRSGNSFNVSAFKDDQFAEINAYLNGSLFQDVATTPGSTITWQFAHRGRDGVDTLNLKIGMPGATIAQINLTNGTTSFTTGNTDWVFYQGTYTVPPGQTITRFEYEAVSTTSNNESVGNFIDAIRFGPLCDHGDAAPGYPVLRADGGAAHVNDGVTFLGNGVQIELDGQPSAGADGDDGIVSDTDNADDEDGVTFTSALQAGNDTTVDIVASVPGNLSAWIDLNQDNDWDDPGEQVLVDESLVAGTNSLNFTIPTDATAGDTYARFRFSTANNLNPTGIAGNGEVEDYQVAIASTAACPTAKADLWFANDESGSVDAVEFNDALDFLYQVSDAFVYDNVTGIKAGVTAWTQQINSINVVIPISESFGDSGDFGLLSTNNITLNGNGQGIRELYSSRRNLNPGTRLDYATSHLTNLITAGNGRRPDTPQIAVILTDADSSDIEVSDNGGFLNWINAATQLRNTGTQIVVILIDEAATAYNERVLSKIVVDNVVGAEGKVVVVPTYAEAANPAEGYVEAASQAICDLTTPVASEPGLLLVKRITAINPGQRAREIQFNDFVDDPNTTDDNDLMWPDSDENPNNSTNIHLRGAINGGRVKPDDEVEYTIYFLSNGDDDAQSVNICDVVPDQMTFVKDSYGIEVGIGLGLDQTVIPTVPNKNLSNLLGDDEGDFYAPGTAPPANLCKKLDSSNNLVTVDGATNTNGAIIVRPPSLPPAISPGTPSNSYGFIRFRAKVK